MFSYVSLESILLSFKDTTVSFPFDAKTPVFKVVNKMFALVALDKKPLVINLKCLPEDALILRSQFQAITPGYHMNKEHWNSVVLDDSLDSRLIMTLIEDSYWLVVKTMSKTEQQRLGINPG